MDLSAFGVGTCLLLRIWILADGTDLPTRIGHFERNQSAQQNTRTIRQVYMKHTVEPGRCLGYLFSHNEMGRVPKINTTTARVCLIGFLKCSSCVSGSSSHALSIRS